MMDHKHLGGSLPVAHFSALSNFDRSTIDRLVVPGTSVWAFSHATNRWEEGVVENTNLLEDRCLFEVRCQNKVHDCSDFLNGHGLSCHSGFHGVDWRFRDPNDPQPPPAHPKQPYPELQYDASLRLALGHGRFRYGQVSLINSAAQSFTVTWGTIQGGSSSRSTHPFNSLREPKRFTFLDSAITVPAYPALQSGNLIETKEGLVYRICAVDPEALCVIGRAVTSTSRRDVRIFSCRSLGSRSSTSTVFDQLECASILARFPELADGRECSVRFRVGEQTVVARTFAHGICQTLPAYLELIKEKPRRLLEVERAQYPHSQLDRFHRFNVRPRDILSVKLL